MYHVRQMTALTVCIVQAECSLRSDWPKTMLIIRDKNIAAALL